MPGWTAWRWKARGGYGVSERGRANAARETIWFSPHCLVPGLPVERTGDLFGAVA